jgi:hypothetical protein
MFIKSQNGFSIINIDSLAELNYDNRFLIGCGYNIVYKTKELKENNSFILGSYNTVTRCEEVFNEICLNIKEGNTLYELPKE